MSVSELVDFYGSRGFGCIAITDHICETSSFLGRAASYLGRTLTQESFPKYMATLEEERKRAWKRYSMLLLPGFELTKNSLFNHRSAHILGIGVSEYISADADVLNLTRRIRAQDALAIAAHPVSTGKFEPQTFHLWSRREELEMEFDAWEVASGTKYFDAVGQSGLPVIATSDLHHAKQIESWKTVFDCRRERNAVLDAVRNQNLEIVFYTDNASLARVKTESNIGSVNRPVNVFC